LTRRNARRYCPAETARYPQEIAYPADISAAVTSSREDNDIDFSSVAVAISWSSPKVAKA